MDQLPPLHVNVGRGLLILAVISLAVSGIYVMGALIGWGTPRLKSRLKKSGIFLGGFVGLGLLNYAWIFWVLLPSFNREMVREREVRRQAASVVHVNEVAPDFQIQDTNGNNISLADLRGKVVLINFFATWCGPCLQELPHLQQLRDQYVADDRFVMIVIGREESNEEVSQFRKKGGYTFPMAADPERAVYAKYADELIPRLYLVSPQGTICYVSTGFSEDFGGAKQVADLKQAIDAQLQSLTSGDG